ncbi:MAG: hypothetical protein JWN10_2632, partial [Solirubrobacterales bacterium]|nr:hypothetical protein [Solirubrobacterales bacterium]
MDFFEPPPKRDLPPEPRRYRTPEWMGPRENVAPAVAPLELVLVNTGEVAVFVTGALVYANGFEMTLTALFKEESELHDPIGMRSHRFRRGAPDGEIPPEMLRFGIQFSDGRKATNVDGPPLVGTDARPDGPLLTSRGGSGGGQRWNQRLWAWPLPPRDELLFVCEWPAQAIELTTAALDAEAIRSAATRAR